MAKDYPDFLGFPGRAGAGESIVDQSGAGEIAGETAAHFDLDAVPEGYEMIIQAVNITVSDDTSIHKIHLFTTPEEELIFASDFITAGIFDFPGVPIPAGRVVRMEITNGSSGILYFVAIAFYILRPV